MLAELSSKAVMTKAKAMYGKRLTPEMYHELMRKRSVAEVAEYLREETSYSEALSSMQPAAVHRGQLENTLAKARFDRYLRLVHFLDTGAEDYYHYLMIEFEVDQILEMARLLNSDRAEEYITQFPEYLQRSMCFSMMDMARARSFDDLAEVLRGTRYYGMVLGCRPQPGGLIDYTWLESVLKGWYYRYMQEIIDKSFRGDTRRQLHNIFDTSIELHNIGVVCRLKQYFPASTPEYIKSVLMPHWKRIPDHALDPMLHAASADEFRRALAASPYARFLGGQELALIEYSGACICCHLYKRYLRSATSAATAFTAYMALSEYELQNIVSVIEGIRYGAAPAEIEKLMIH